MYTERLKELYNADAGFYVLGLHSLIELIARKELHTLLDRSKFHELLNQLMHRRGYSKERYNAKEALLSGHDETNEVRHEFATLNRQFAIGQTQTFIRFVNAFGFSDLGPEELIPLKTILQAWERKDLCDEDKQEIELLKQELSRYQEKTENLSEELQELQVINQQMQDK